MSLYATAVLFAYQTLDAVDGKHARATKQSSPLGQLFDHGCDATNVIFSQLLWAQAFQMGSSNAYFVYLLAASTNFYTG